MDDLRLLIAFGMYLLIVLLTIGLFSFFSKKYKKLGHLLFLVLIPVWLLIATIKGVELLYFDNSSDLFFLGGFGLLLAETLPILLIFGVITFVVKYMKLKKT